MVCECRVVEVCVDIKENQDFKNRAKPGFQNPIGHLIDIAQKLCPSLS
jgi:hypothetical protein